AQGMAGAMGYLTDHRAAIREDARYLLPSARSVICVGKLYDTPQPYSTEFDDVERGWISRYAWGDDYHGVLRKGLESLVARMRERVEFDYKICVDTAPVLERAYARHAGLGWIARNTCLINQDLGSWFFLGEVLISLELETGHPPPDRCGACTACIDACPTQAIVPAPGPGWAIDSRLCISYYTIEFKGIAPAGLRPSFGNHVFGCDVCQDVCPWNRSRHLATEPGFEAREFAPALDRLAGITEPEFARMFQSSPVNRSRYAGFLRNVAIAMGNTGSLKFAQPLRRLVHHEDVRVSEAASWSLDQLKSEDV
ncbi:MAG: tRNA epoxyqueuosine(34) reductase QueG, partial [Bryobacteraceae bacterium]